MTRFFPALLLASTLLPACSKRCGDDRSRPVDLEVVEVGLPDRTFTNGTIQATVRYAIPGSCYSFNRFDIHAQPGAFEVRVKGHYNGGGICEDWLRLPDSTITLNAPAPGQYLLHFYSKDALFRTDTVQVN